MKGSTKRLSVKTRKQILERDEYTCRLGLLCDGSPLEIHHIDGNTSNNNPKNLVSLCRKCHVRMNRIMREERGYFKKGKNPIIEVTCKWCKTKFLSCERRGRVFCSKSCWRLMGSYSKSENAERIRRGRIDYTLYRYKTDPEYKRKMRESITRYQERQRKTYYSDPVFREKKMKRNREYMKSYRAAKKLSPTVSTGKVS